ncbi:HAD family hydrolase [Jannaschia rubra]|uniref:phosphoglycolate phosphatase n=1 Tax=Jannaschia rubra TaxID=282197 RepID=A0A0M6XS14_9RHOB|nr:HAD family hydrolase [Jannaschia rubra]CTQ32834.1 phosphoglycolate phosphatase [Jannaschia rubra]SFG81473.1 phosphoglycolate phosphatase [Jannaschia rubra]
MIRAILFDKDGTLTDFRATWEWWMPGMIAALARDSGYDPVEIGAAFGFDMKTGRILSDGLFVTAPGHITTARVAERIGWEVHRLSAWLALRSREVRQVPVPGLPRLFAELREGGLAIGVLTNADEKEARHHLQQMGLAPLVDRLIGCDTGFGAKPDPAGAADFADALGFARNEVAMVGDGLTDMAAALGAGLFPVGVLTGTLDRATLSAHASVVLPDVTHLTDWLIAQGILRARS